MNMRYIIQLAIAALLTIGCSESQEGVQNPTDSPVIFGTPSTRVADAVDDFAEGDNIYIAASDDAASRVVGGESLYSVTSTKDITSADPLFWFDDNLSFYAVNQQLVSSGSLLSYDLTTADDELLWVALFDQNRSDNESAAIDLKFNRCLSKAQVSVTYDGIYAAVNPSLRIYFKSYNAMAFDPWAATFEVQNPSGKPTTNDDYQTSWSSATAVNSTTYELLTLPQTIEALTEMWLVVEDSEGDKTTRITTSAKSIVLESGCVTKINITIKKDSDIAVVTMGSVDLIPFEEATVEAEDQTIIPNHE